MGKIKHSGKILDKETVQKRLVPADRSEEVPEQIPCAELSDNDDYAEETDKEITVLQKTLCIWGYCNRGFYFSKAGREEDHSSLHS